MTLSPKMGRANAKPLFPEAAPTGVSSGDSQVGAAMTADQALRGMMQHLGWWFDAHRPQFQCPELQVVAARLYDVIRQWRIMGAP